MKCFFVLPLAAWLALLVGGCGPGPLPGAQPPPGTATPVTPPPGWKLVWSDEFDGADGSAVDAAKWSFAAGGGGWGNGELEGYTDKLDNASIQEGTFADDYHIFALEWEPGEMRWYVDGDCYQTLTKWHTSSTKGAYPAPFDRRFYLILNVAVGGAWPGYPDETTIFPQAMLADYVRIYQRQ